MGAFCSGPCVPHDFGFAVMAPKTALVTGASRGIGRGIAIELARAGCRVAINYAGNVEAAAEGTQGVVRVVRPVLVLGPALAVPQLHGAAAAGDFAG